jgi:methylenetetrahydrofolate dehydrogenase (NADP+)/methenyltetrahydrofolate cyclohydrolase/formyltetrahydrofolate synthetase
LSPCFDILENCLSRTDTEAELKLVQEEAVRNGAFGAAVSSHWADGGAGAVKLAEAVMSACDRPNQFKFLYDLDKPFDEKIQTISREMYGAKNVVYTSEVASKLKMYEEKGYGNLPICMAKTAGSLTGDPTIKGAPTGFDLKINDVSLSAGAGFVIPIVGEVSKKNISCEFLLLVFSCRFQQCQVYPQDPLFTILM